MPDALAPADLPTPEATHQAWPEPDLSLLEDPRPDLPEFPLQCLPAWWRAWASGSAHASAAPVEYVVQALLAAVGSLCGSGVVVRLRDGWEEPLILWQALVGAPSTGKSAALNAMRRALARVEQATPGYRGAAIVDRPTALPALLAVARKRPGGALLWRDDPAPWPMMLGCNGRREPIEVSALLAAWSPLGTALGPGSPAVGIVGSLDPARLGEALAGCDDGRADRFLYAWPARPDWRSLRERPAVPDDTMADALGCIAGIAGDPALPRQLVLDEAALAAFDEHLARVHALQRQADGVEAAWLGKGRGTVARLAAALALLGWSAGARRGDAPPPVITGETMAAACTLWDYFHRHARAVLGRAFAVDRPHLMRRVLGWIGRQRATEVSREEVRREALGQAVDAAEAQRVIDALAQAGFLRAIAAAPGAQGRPALRWNVHPALLDRGAGSARIAKTAPPAMPRSADAVSSCPDTS